MSNHFFRLTAVDKKCTPIERLTCRGNYIMNKINKINPIAKQLPKLGKRVVPDKRRKKMDKETGKEIRDAKTGKDS